MSGIAPGKFKELAQLYGILRTYARDIVLPLPDGVISFTYRLVMELVADCVTKYYQGCISSEYLEQLKKNIRTLVQQAEERSQSGDLASFKELAQKVLCVLEYPARSLEHLAVIGSLSPVRKPCKSDYTQIREIARGTFGVVHLVRHKDTNQVFAMKKLSRRILNHPLSLSRAYLERDISIFSDCPFVISTFCSFPTKHHLCMVMEFAAGGDCGSLINCIGPLPFTLAHMYIAETVLGVEYLHSIGVVHRDLKPENLMISSNGHIKITDFGLSILGFMNSTSDIYKAPTEDITTEFRNNRLIGTPCYMAPEIILMRGYGRPIDWWSLGVIIHEFITGRVPFIGDCANDLFKKILMNEITWEFDDSNPPPDAQDIITKLLRKNPAQRLGTGGANEIKSHPFLRDVDFENLHNKEPLLKPHLVPEVDTANFNTCMKRHSDSDEGDANEVKDWPESLNYVSSTQRLSKLLTTNDKMNTEDRKSSPGCLLGTSTEHSDVQKETSPSGNDENNKSSSPTSSVEKKIKSALKVKKEQKTEIIEEREPRRGSTFRRMISSVRRGFSRAARTIRESSLFTVHQRGTLDLARTKHLEI